MSLMSLDKRLRKLERKVRSREDNSFTLMELCRAWWTKDKEHFKERAQGTMLSVAVRHLQAEDAMREREQELREEEARRSSGALPRGAQHSGN